jgi:hypothetical protein
MWPCQTGSPTKHKYMCNYPHNYSCNLGLYFVTTATTYGLGPIKHWDDAFDSSQEVRELFESGLWNPVGRGTEPGARIRKTDSASHQVVAQLLSTPNILDNKLLVFQSSLSCLEVRFFVLQNILGSCVWEKSTRKTELFITKPMKLARSPRFEGEDWSPMLTG